MPRSDLLPPAMMRFVLRALGRATLTGNYPDWQSAMAAAAPYRTDLGVYSQLAEEVRAGRRRSARVLSPLLAGLNLSGAPSRVLDFGGGLGLAYLEVSRLTGVEIEAWHVVDLPDVVAFGNEHFADDTLRFFPTIDQAAADGPPSLISCCHVLQYLDAPFEYITRLLRLAPQVVVLNELPLGARERFMVQRLLPELGGGSRPIRIFGQATIDAAFHGYRLIDEIELPAWDRSLAGARQVSRVYRRSEE